jgi:hypothetical protein
MAYDKAHLAAITYANGRTGWQYDTLDTAATVDSAAYFTGRAIQMLRVGDIIRRRTWATAIGTGTISTAGDHVVNANNGTTVDVTDSTALDQTDTD